MRKYDNKKNKRQYKKLNSEGREKATRVKSRTIPLTTLAGQHKNGGLYTAPHTPAESAGVCRTLPDSGRLKFQCDMGQICQTESWWSLPESARLRGIWQTPTGLSPPDSGRLSPAESAGISVRQSLQESAGVCRSLPEPGELRLN